MSKMVIGFALRALRLQILHAKFSQVRVPAIIGLLDCRSRWFGRDPFGYGKGCEIAGSAPPLAYNTGLASWIETLVTSES